MEISRAGRSRRPPADDFGAPRRSNYAGVATRTRPGSTGPDQLDQLGSAVPHMEEFERLAAPLRAELVAYCYRMVGSADDAEDLAQETYLRAWRSYATFEGRS